MLRLRGDHHGEVTVTLKERDSQKSILIEQDSGNGPTDLVSISFSDAEELIDFLRNELGDYL